MEREDSAVPSSWAFTADKSPVLAQRTSTHLSYEMPPRWELAKKEKVTVVPRPGPGEEEWEWKQGLLWKSSVRCRASAAPRPPGLSQAAAFPGGPRLTCKVGRPQTPSLCPTLVQLGCVTNMTLH